MTFAGIVCATLAFSVVLLPALAADDDALTRMALCKDSWADWQKGDPAKLKAFGDSFHAHFSPHDNDPYFLPKAKVAVLGMNVSQAFPGSVGMGVGFSLTLDGTFDDTRKAAEKALGKALQKCESGEGMRNCELQIASQRTVTLMSEDKPGTGHTLIGCYYFYEK
ncbi:MAG TPA: hypothetical protein VHW69_12320 [Rhizomicrobium sp.]|jgi:hypothetical protein|nr:hypothetical protein [Rhizomicrobium sp.]